MLWAKASASSPVTTPPLLKGREYDASFLQKLNIHCGSKSAIRTCTLQVSVGLPKSVALQHSAPWPEHKGLLCVFFNFFFFFKSAKSSTQGSTKILLLNASLIEKKNVTQVI